LLLLTAARICSAFFCVSRSVEDSWFHGSNVPVPARRHGTGRHYAIYNTVDVHEMERVQSESAGEDVRRRLDIEGRKVVGVVGRLRREKGHRTLLRAMKSVLRALPSAVLVVVGDGPDREVLEKEAALLGIADNIRWLGQQDQSEVYRLYSVMDVVAVPSLFEGFGLVAAEAMAAAVPVVASHVGGLPEVVSHGVTGLIVAPEDDSALAVCLLLLLRGGKEAKTMGEEGRKRAKMLFSPELFGDDVLSVYESPEGYRTARFSPDRAL
jgi:glycosyltransferase involved in cell wall biosynthesis